MVRPPGRQSPMGSKMNTLYEKKLILCAKHFFKLLRQITGNSINNFEFLKIIIFVRGRLCDYSFRTTKNLATPLCTTVHEFTSNMPNIYLCQMNYFRGGIKANS